MAKKCTESGHSCRTDWASSIVLTIELPFSGRSCREYALLGEDVIGHCQEVRRDGIPEFRVKLERDAIRSCCFILFRCRECEFEFYVS